MPRRRRHVRPERPSFPPLGHWAVAVIRASYVLPAGAKLVHQLLGELDRGDGAFLAPAEAAAQLGMHQRSFEEARTALVRLGLVVQKSAEGSRLDYWFPRLPKGFEYAPPPGSTLDERRGWVRHWAGKLDQELERVKDSPKWSRPERVKDAPINESETRSPGTLNESFPQAQRVEDAPTEHDNGASARLSVTLNAVVQGVGHTADPDSIESKGVRQDPTTPPPTAPPNPRFKQMVDKAMRDAERQRAAQKAAP